MSPEIAVVIFFMIAFFYSSIGFGGGSSYLALLSLFMDDFFQIRSTALLFNVVVVLIGTHMFFKHRIFDFKKFIPFVITGVPLAFIGSTIELSQKSFFILLGSVLVLSAIFLLLPVNKGKVNPSLSLGKIPSGGIGGTIGLLSGMVGIGGGIFLSPMLNLIRRQDAKIIASLTSFYILSNSLAGISGLLYQGTFRLETALTPYLLTSVVVGGILGSRVSIRLSSSFIQSLTALLIFYVGVKLILAHTVNIHI